MQMITIEAGTRLAKAKAALDAAAKTTIGDVELYRLLVEYEKAGDAVADELVANGYHDLDGGEE